MSRALKAVTQAAPVAQYGRYRPKFRSGDVIAQSHGDWSSWKSIKVMGVRVFTLSTYSHVAVIDVDPVDGRVYVVEAVEPCVHRVPLSTIGSFYHLPLHATWTDGTSEFVHQVLGTEYSQWDAMRAFFRPLPDGTVSECAALTREVLKRAAVDLGPMSRPDAVVQRCLALRSSLTFIQNGATSTTQETNP